MTTKKFASHADLEEKKVSFTRLSENAYAYTAEGDPNTGIFIGDEAVMVVDTQATPAMAQDVIRRIREVTPLPIKYVLLSHYHAVRVLGASAYFKEGAEHAHRVVVRQHDVLDRLVAHLADAADHVLRHRRRGLRVRHQHRVVADDDAGVRVALGGVRIGVIRELGEADLLLFEVGLGGELLRGVHAVS